MTNKDKRLALIAIAEPVCESAGYELVDLRYAKGQLGWVVTVFIDAINGRAINFKDCESVSRELSAVFDVEDPITNAYSLEVSSPGLDRPLRTADHFRQYIGSTAKLSTVAAVSGRRKFKGVLVSVDNESVITIAVNGTEYHLPLAKVSTAKLVPDWDALMKENRSAKQA